jgi:hypothetical protein
MVVINSLPKLNVSYPFNQWNDAARVDKSDLDLEQTRSINTEASIIANHFGSGVLPEAPVQKILFDSDILTTDQNALIFSNDFDGTGIAPTVQPSDVTLGNQIEVELSNSTVYGRFSVKVLVVGLDFEGNLQYERFQFYKNGSQVSKKHFTKILSLFFNDFKGNNKCSRYLGGRVVIKEAKSLQFSSDNIMLAQDLEPNIFFRDFKPSGLFIGPNPTVTLYQMLQQGIGSVYNVDELGIDTTAKINRFLLAGDSSSRIGEKFLAKTDNIQKFTLLLGVSKNGSVSVDNWFDWSGSLVFSLYELQNTVSCPTDIIPELSIEFTPNPVPIVQSSYTQAELAAIGYVLTDVVQPVDFVFSGSKIAAAGGIVPGKYYALAIQRSGTTTTGDLFAAIGGPLIENSRLTLFNGSSWVDVPEEQMWFQVWTDAIKVSDGKAYDKGVGVQVNKVETNELGVLVDYVLGGQSFVNTGEGTLNIGIVQAVLKQFQEEQSERTGNPVWARQEYVPAISLLTQTSFNTLSQTEAPVVLGVVEDTNPVLNPVINGVTSYAGLVNGNVFTIVNPDADILSQNLIGSQLIPDTTCSTVGYKIFKTLVCSDGYGDVNGDGVIDGYDVVLVTSLVGESIWSPTTQQKIYDGYFTTLELLRADVDGDGYITSNDVTLITNYVNRVINSFPVGSTFTHVDLFVQPSTGRYDGYYSCYDGYVWVTPSAQPISLFSQKELYYFGYYSEPSIDGYDLSFSSAPFTAVPYSILPQSFWQSYLVNYSSNAREVPAIFTSINNDPPNACSFQTDLCENKIEINPEFDSGKNDFFVPNNLVIGNGNIVNSDGSVFKVDLEIGTVILQLPETPLTEAIINVFEKFVYDRGDGITNGGFPAMKFSDCTTVKSDALIKNQVRFGVAIQAFNPNLDGYTFLDGYAIIIDDYIGVHIDQTTGLLTLSVKDLDVSPLFQTLVTKIEITVFLKKAGWVNQVLTILPNQIAGLLI